VILDEIDKDLERLGTQSDLFGTAAQKAVVEIQRELAKRVLAARVLRSVLQGSPPAPSRTLIDV
jgi:hypothetical protein